MEGWWSVSSSTVPAWVQIPAVLKKKKKKEEAGYWLPKPVTLATEEAEIRRIVVQRQPRQIVCETLSWKYLTQKRAGRVAQDVGPEFKTHTAKQKKWKWSWLCLLQHYQSNVLVLDFFMSGLLRIFYIKDYVICDVFNSLGVLFCCCFCPYHTG
jgi:hypothetical protein